jgi:hypothetical protein
MNEQNLDYLSRQIKFTGFGEDHDKELKTKMESNAPNFVILHQQEFGKDNIAATLHFRKSEQSDLYFFNKYDLLLKNANQPDLVKQAFYINPKEDNITLKEGYNLLNGRAIQKEHQPKEGQKYNAWFQLDFKEMDKNGQFKMKQYHPNYGFDLEASLHKLPIQEMSTNEGIKRLLESLERGNRQQVTLGEPGKEQKVYLEASPQFKSVNVYDSSMKRVMANDIKPKGEELGNKNVLVPEASQSNLQKNKLKPTVEAINEEEIKPKKQRSKKL